MVKKKKEDPIEEFFKSFVSADNEADFKFGHEVFAQTPEVISTSSLVLDDALSAGGLPKGRIIQYYGKAASGKSLNAMLAIKEAQKENLKARQIWIDAEGSFDGSWAENLGIDLERIFIVEKDTAVYGQKLFELLLGIPKEDKKHKFAGKSKEGMLDNIANGKLNINMIVLDSLGAVLSPGLDTAFVGQVTIGKNANFYTQIFPKLSIEVKKANVPFVVINHVKDGMDPYGPDHSYSGGNAYTHHLSANVYFYMSRSKDASILDEHGDRVGGIITATVEKSKFGPHPKKCEFKVDFRTGIVELEEQVAELAIKYGIIKKTSKVSYEYGDEKWVGQNKVSEAIRDNQELFTELKTKVEEARLNKITQKIAEQEQRKQELMESEEEELETEETV